MLMTNEQHPAKLYEKQILRTCSVLLLIIGVWEDRAAPGTIQLADSAAWRRLAPGLSMPRWPCL